LTAWVNAREKQDIQATTLKRALEQVEPARRLDDQDAAGEITNLPVHRAGDSQDETVHPPAKKVCTAAKRERSSLLESEMSSVEPKRPNVHEEKAIALHTVTRRRGESVRRPDTSSPSAPAASSTSKESTPARPPIDLNQEIERVLAAHSPEEVFGLEASELCEEEAVARAWKRLMLLLHPDKLQGLDDGRREAGAEALNRVHEAKEELRRQQQQTCAELPATPIAAGEPHLAESRQGLRKYEISWVLPQSQDPRCPVEKYEIWGPRYFSEAGDPYDWVLLATLPPLQSHFVLVEEAPTQQDVMWAADRVLRPTLPITVHAANGKGPSEALAFELPWATVFPWLRGTQSLLCPGCLQLMPRHGGPWSKCSSCGFGVPVESAIVIRCPECQGEVLWNNGVLSCSCCLKRFAEKRSQRGHSFPKRSSSPSFEQQRGQKQWCRGGPNANACRQWGRPR